MGSMGVASCNATILKILPLFLMKIHPCPETVTYMC